MRFLFASMIMCFGVAGFCQEVVADPAPAEVTISEEGNCDEVAVSESLRDFSNCGCGNKDPKPKL